jgi:hypothetical protein
VYGIARALGAHWTRRHLFWDSPVPAEHTFECTAPDLARLCAPYLQLVDTVGVATGWAFPGWGWMLNRFPKPVAIRLLARVDWTARRLPRLADYKLTVWRPR